MRRGKTDRAYRRMPDQAELKATYLQSRTITGVAAHYGVPTHTAQGWISRLRRKGVIPAGK
jgi:transposase